MLKEREYKNATTCFDFKKKLNKLSLYIIYIYIYIHTHTVHSHNNNDVSNSGLLDNDIHSGFLCKLIRACGPTCMYMYTHAHIQ